MRVEVKGACLAVALVAAVTMTPLFNGGGPRASQEVSGHLHRGPGRAETRALRVGMTEREVLRTDWGRPDRVETSSIAPGDLQYWFYEHRHNGAVELNGVVLIDDGVVTYFRENAPR